VKEALNNQQLVFNKTKKHGKRSQKILIKTKKLKMITQKMRKHQLSKIKRKKLNNKIIMRIDK
jgi:hypothetical protein